MKVRRGEERQGERNGKLEVGMASEKKEFAAKVKGGFTTLLIRFSFLSLSGN
jgi:hypothetical protein